MLSLYYTIYFVIICSAEDLFTLNSNKFRMVYKVDGNPQLDSRDWSMYANILNLLKLQTKNSYVFPQVRRNFSEKQYTVMWQVLWLPPSPEQARPYVKASERKLRGVGFLELILSQGRKSKNSNVNNFLSS